MAQSNFHSGEVAQNTNEARWSPPTHPGEIIRRRFIEDLGHNQTEICRKFGIDKSRLNRILMGRADINVDDSRNLARAFGLNPLFFLDLQVKYNEAKENRPDSFIGDRADNDPTHAAEQDAG